MTTPESRLSREEWDFEALISKIGDRLVFAFGYEFGRELPGVIAAHEEDRRVHRRIDEAGNWHCVLVKRDPNRVVEFADCFPYLHNPDGYNDGFLPDGKIPHFEFEIIDAPSGFPDTPYLLLNPAHQLGSRSHFPTIPKRLGFTQAYLDQGQWINGNRQFVPPDEVYNIHIEWTLNNSEIEADFARWLTTLTRPRDAVERRGTGGGRELLTDLKSLGAWRLLKVHQDDFRAARAFTQQQGKPSGLFVRKEDWDDARDRAQAILDDWACRDICG